MLSGTIPPVDYRDIRKLTGKPCCSDLRMPENDGICVPAHNPDSICQGFSLSYRTHLNPAQINAGPSQSEHGRFKRHPGTGAGFKEEKAQYFSFQRASRCSVLCDKGSTRDKMVNLATLQIPDRYVMFHKVSLPRLSVPVRRDLTST